MTCSGKNDFRGYNFGGILNMTNKSVRELFTDSSLCILLIIRIQNGHGFFLSIVNYVKKGL